MAKYKCVPGPVGLRIGAKDSYDKAVRSYADIIQSEAVGGWDFFMMQQIPVIQQAGCLAGIFGAKETMITFNMLIFRKEE